DPPSSSQVCGSVFNMTSPWARMTAVSKECVTLHLLPSMVRLSVLTRSRRAISQKRTSFRTKTC
ncbi:hypothetical protein EDD11_006699, partial [Mortierella claussenii]